MDWAAEGLLNGLEGDERAARARLLDALHADGAELSELRAAVAEDRLVLLPIERALLGPACFTLAELAERGGVDAEAAQRRLRALGRSIPDADVVAFSADDVEGMERLRASLDAGMDTGELRAVTHLLSSLMARAAGPVRQLFAQTFLEPGVGEDELGLRYGEMAAALRPLVAAELDYMLRLHLRDFARSDALGMAERSSGKLPDTFDVAVAFADIVGFTALGEELPTEDLSGIAERLEELADDHIEAPARVVKTIGDAVMVVSREPGPLVAGMVALMDAAGGDPALRTGITYGRAVSRLGDWYGPAVNLAARLTSRARPDSILVTNALRDALGDDGDAYAFSEAGPKRFKGIAEPVPVLRLRRAVD